MAVKKVDRLGGGSTRGVISNKPGEGRAVALGESFISKRSVFPTFLNKKNILKIV